MTVALLPPASRSWGKSGQPLKNGPAFVRSRAGTLWHRSRSGVLILQHGGIVWHCWCGISRHDGRSTVRDDAPKDEPVCATCEGRAFGSGQLPGDTDYATQFTPMYVDPPRRCPGSRDSGLFAEVNWRVGRCLVCAELLPIRAAGSPYNPTVGLVVHAPGVGLVPRCDFHGWQYMRAVDGKAVCNCGGSGVFNEVAS